MQTNLRQVPARGEEMIDKIRWAVNYTKEQLCTRIEHLEADNARLKEQNIQLTFATDLLVKEMNELKTDVNISP